VEIAQKDMYCVQVIDIKKPNHTPGSSSIVHQMCRCALYIVTAFSLKRPFAIEFRARDQRRSP